jgi:hypothetical protein
MTFWANAPGRLRYKFKRRHAEAFNWWPLANNQINIIIANVAFGAALKLPVSNTITAEVDRTTAVPPAERVASRLVTSVPEKEDLLPETPKLTCGTPRSSYPLDAARDRLVQPNARRDAKAYPER